MYDTPTIDALTRARLRWCAMAEELGAGTADGIEENALELGCELDSPGYYRECIGQGEAELGARSSGARDETARLEPRCCSCGGPADGESYSSEHRSWAWWCRRCLVMQTTRGIAERAARLPEAYGAARIVRGSSTLHAVRYGTSSPLCSSRQRPFVTFVRPGLDAVTCHRCLAVLKARADTRRFVAERVPSGQFWAVRDRAGSELRYNGRATSLLSWDGMTEQTARDIADRYEAGFRPL